VTYLPRVTEQDVAIVNQEVGENEASYKNFTINTLNYIEDTQPAITDFLQGLMKIYGKEEWAGLFLFCVTKMYRMLDLAYSRAQSLEGSALPVVVAEIGAPIQEQLYRGKKEYLQVLILEVFHDNLLITKMIANETWLYSGQRESHLIVSICSCIYKMIDNQLEVLDLEKT
jgi:hypothetical protein